MLRTVLGIEGLYRRFSRLLQLVAAAVALEAKS